MKRPSTVWNPDCLIYSLRDTLTPCEKKTHKIKEPWEQHANIAFAQNSAMSFPKHTKSDKWPKGFHIDRWWTERLMKFVNELQGGAIQTSPLIDILASITKNCWTPIDVLISWHFPPFIMSRLNAGVPCRIIWSLILLFFSLGSPSNTEMQPGCFWSSQVCERNHRKNGNHAAGNSTTGLGIAMNDTPDTWDGLAERPQSQNNFPEIQLSWSLLTEILIPTWHVCQTIVGPPHCIAISTMINCAWMIGWQRLLTSFFAHSNHHIN